MHVDPEKAMAEHLVQFRAKCSELNLVNAEMGALEKLRKEIRKDYDAYAKKADANNTELAAVGHRLTEVRSELQAMQAKLLDMTIDYLLRLSR